MQKAMTIALEGLPRDAFELMGKRSVRRLVVLYVQQFSLKHGVAYSEDEILNELDAEMLKRHDTEDLTPPPESEPLTPRTITKRGVNEPR